MIRWKPISNVALNGDPFKDSLERLDGRTLEQIQAMPQAAPIEFAPAYRMCGARFDRYLLGRPPGEGQNIPRWEWLWAHWVAWVSRQGYQIKLKGDEYEEVPDVLWVPTLTPDLALLEITIGGTPHRLLTSSKRPPIRAIHVVDESRIQLEYETGEMEAALRPLGWREYFLESLIREIFLGQPSKIHKFSWAS